jgi:hypothetical protein
VALLAQVRTLLDKRRVLPTGNKHGLLLVTAVEMWSSSRSVEATGCSLVYGVD